jgi:hypothetical protein
MSIYYLLGSVVGILPDPLLWLFVIIICAVSVKNFPAENPLSISYILAGLFAVIYSALLRGFILSHRFADDEAIVHTILFIVVALVIVSIFFGVRRVCNCNKSKNAK